MGKLFCILGKSGSGKDTLFKSLMVDKELNLKPVVTYTTRPKRDNETEGVEYHFICKNDVENYRKSGKIIELRKYNTVHGIWYYCTVDDGKIDFSKNDYLIISTLEAFREFKKRFGEKAVALYITVEDGERLSRALNRERAQSSPDYSEMCRRFLADREDFSEKNLEEVGICKNFENIDEKACVLELKRFIQKNKN